MSADKYSHAEVRAMKVTIESKIAGTQLERFHQLYRSAFEPLLTLTAVRQVLTEDEFEAQMTDERVDKLVAWDGDEPIGMMTVTRELETVPWISPSSSGRVIRSTRPGTRSSMSPSRWPIRTVARPCRWRP